jgi:iron complex outermembrane receptor protein
VQEDQFGIVQRGTPITGVPDWLATFGVDYDRRNLAVGGDDLNVPFEGQYTGKQATTYDLTGFQNVGPIPGVQPFGTYQYYNVSCGATTFDPNGGISPFVVFNLDLNYTLPISNRGIVKLLDFDLNVLNLFNQQYFQYFYRQISPASCGTFKTGQFADQAVSNYGCSPQFADAIPGEPFAITFTARARF